MALAVLWNGKRIGAGQFVAGAAVCVGLLLFALADAAVLPNFDPRGIILVVMSVCADAVLPNLQVC
jgi:hypothetical protein